MCERESFGMRSRRAVRFEIEAFARRFEIGFKKARGGSAGLILQIDGERTSMNQIKTAGVDRSSMTAVFAFV